jgi:hypothetical protein
MKFLALSGSLLWIYNIIFGYELWAMDDGTQITICFSWWTCKINVFFVQVMFYIAMSEAFMGWGFNSPL